MASTRQGHWSHLARRVQCSGGLRQENADGDTMGDVCDPDEDNDTLLDVVETKEDV